MPPSLPTSCNSWILNTNVPPLVLFLYKSEQYQRQGIGELDLKDQRQKHLKYQQAPQLELAGMAGWHFSKHIKQQKQQHILFSMASPLKGLYDLHSGGGAGVFRFIVFTS